MPDIFTTVQYFGPGGSSGEIEVYGSAVDSDSHYEIGWNTIVSTSDNATLINTALKNAAVAGFASLDPPITVGVSDKKILFGGAA